MSDLAADLALLLGGDPFTKSLSELITIVRNRGDFRNPRRFTNDMITVELRAAFAELYELIADTNEGYFDTSDTVTTTASTGFVALPSGAWRVRAVDRLDGTDYIEMHQIAVSHRNRWGSSTGTPVSYRLTARGIDLYPTPDATYTLRVTYTPAAPALDEEQRAFFNGWEEFVVYGALVRIAENEERDTSEWERQFEKQRARIIRGATQRKSQEPEYLTLRDAPLGLDDPHPWWSW